MQWLSDFNHLQVDLICASVFTVQESAVLRHMLKKERVTAK